MKFSLLLGILSAFLLHAGFLLFGGLIIPEAKKEGSLTKVELLADVDKPKDPPKPDEKPPEEIKTDQDQPPEPVDTIKVSDAPPLDNNTPKLDAVSLNALTNMLNNVGGDGGFGQDYSLESGGSLSGTRRGGGLQEKLDDAFSLAEIDQKPRPVYQTSPVYPAEMRGKKVDGLVTIIFVVDSSGKVGDARVETSSGPAFDKAALSAVKKWKFEPGVKGGERVACKMRVPIRFPVPS